MARAFLIAGAILLLLTAGIHAAGLSLVRGWVQGLPPHAVLGLQFVWLSDSLDWSVAALIWALAAVKQQGPWRTAAALAALIPLIGAIGVLSIDPTFFGGYLLAGSTLLAFAGILTYPRTGRGNPPDAN